jgi:hypothetical protein
MQMQKVKEQLAARLDVPKEACLTADNIRWVKQEVEGVCVELSENACYSNHHCLAGQWLC